MSPICTIIPYFNIVSGGPLINRSVIEINLYLTVINSDRTVCCNKIFKSVSRQCMHHKTYALILFKRHKLLILIWLNQV
jgi:hypothetical protein